MGSTFQDQRQQQQRLHERADLHADRVAKAGLQEQCRRHLHGGNAAPSDPLAASRMPQSPALCLRGDLHQHRQAGATISAHPQRHRHLGFPLRRQRSHGNQSLHADGEPGVITSFRASFNAASPAASGDRLSIYDDLVFGFPASCPGSRSRPRLEAALRGTSPTGTFTFCIKDSALPRRSARTFTLRRSPPSPRPARRSSTSGAQHVRGEDQGFRPQLSM